jgi:hypothetical protein
MSTKRQHLIDRLASLPEDLLDEVEEHLDDIEDERASRESGAARRRRASQRLEALFERLRAHNPQGARSPDEIRQEEEEIAEEIRLMRHQQRHG